MQQTLIAITIILMTISIYLLMTRLYLRFSLPFLLPILTSTILIITLLTAAHLSYQTFMIGGKWINLLLGPAVVSLSFSFI